MMSGNLYVRFNAKPVLGGDPTVLLRVAQGVSLETIEKNAIWLALVEHREDAVAAADALGISVRTVYRNKAIIDEAGASLDVGQSLSDELLLIVVKEGETLDEIKRNAVRAALRICNGNRTKAASMVGISVRTIQRRYLSTKNQTQQEQQQAIAT